VTKVFIPFRDRGLDPRRAANLEVVMAWWYAHGFDPRVVSDGLEGDAPFNRHRAYNDAVSGNPDVLTFVFTEADMLIHPDQIHLGLDAASMRGGLVVPFTQYRYLTDDDTVSIRDEYHDRPTSTLARMWALPPDDPRSVFQIEPESTMDNGSSIGAVNIVSRATLQKTGGFTEATHGNWYDDRIIEQGFAYLSGRKTEFIEGPAVHLYHLPGWKGDHLSDADRAATEHNRQIMVQMQRNIRMGRRSAVRDLMEFRKRVTQ